jgi:hypothetical protein
MVGLETVKQRQHIVCVRADQLAKQGRDLRFILVAEFALTWRDPQRRRGAIVCHPLPFGQEQLIRSAEPHFRLVSSESGRLDYIETITQWNKRIGAPSFRKTLFKIQLLPRWLASADFQKRPA